MLLVCGAIFALGFLILNYMAYRQVWAMTHFVRKDASRTAPPEALSKAAKLKILFTGVTIPRPENTKTPADFNLTFSTHRFNGALGTKLEAWQVPHETAKGIFILFHGYASCKESMLPVAGALHEMGYECWLVDFHGSGGSSGDTTSIAWHEAEDVAASFQFVKKQAGESKVFLMGASLGAAAILRSIAVQHIEPDGVILECPFHNLLGTTANRFRTMHLPAFPLAHLLVFWGGHQFDFNGFSHNPAEYARAVRCPVLLMNGDSDARVTRADIQAVRDGLSAPTSFHIFNQTGHESYLQKNPTEWKQTVHEWWQTMQRP